MPLRARHLGRRTNFRNHMRHAAFSASSVFPCYAHATPGFGRYPLISDETPRLRLPTTTSLSRPFVSHTRILVFGLLCPRSSMHSPFHALEMTKAAEVGLPRAPKSNMRTQCKRMVGRAGILAGSQFVVGCSAC